jgi:hypothetical protein
MVEYQQHDERGILLQTIQNLDETMVKQIGTNYANFFYDYVNFILAFFLDDELSAGTEEEQMDAEHQLAQSLFLIEKIHMYLIHHISYYEKYLSLQRCDHPLQSYGFNSNYELFRKLKNLISSYPFIQRDMKKMCEKSISQILSYYPEHSSMVRFIVSPLPPPWINHL